MKNLKTFSTFFILVFACKEYLRTESRIWIIPFLPDPNIKIGKLDNGLHIILNKIET